MFKTTTEKFSISISVMHFACENGVALENLTRTLNGRFSVFRVATFGNVKLTYEVRRILAE